MSPQPQAAVGRPVSRVEGRLKVTGQAKYAADQTASGTAHAAVVDSSIARGRITGLDTAAAEACPGVLRVISHRNAPTLPYLPNRGSLNLPGERLHVFQDDRVLFHGQPVAVVVATTLEAAQHAASLVHVQYTAEPSATDLTSAPADEPTTYARGDAAAALASAAVRLDLTYRLSRMHHNPMEPHAIVTRWDGAELTVWDKTQWVQSTRDELAAVFGINPASVRVISPYVGGAFGNAARCWPHATIAALAAREAGRPVKLVLTRRQLYFGVGYRPAYEYRLSIGSDLQGRLTASVHDLRSETSRYETFAERGVLVPGRMLYTTPNVTQSHRTVPLDVNTPTPMRGPGYSTAAFPIESAVDELAHELGIDPIELRRRNEPENDQASGLPFSTRRLRECYTVGAREFGWNRRNPKPRTTRDGDWLIGMGVATAVYDTLRAPAQAHVRLDARGTAVVESATSDMGPGTYTSMSQVAADALGIDVPQVTFRLGDTTLPQAPVHGGSLTMASIGSTVQDGCDRVRQQAIALAVGDERSPLYGADPAAVVVYDGRLHVKGDPARGETYRQLLTRNDRTHLEATGSYTPAQSRASMHAYGAVFAEVAVDARLGMVRVRRMLGVYDAGRIISPKLADSQAIGGMVGGIGAALMEHTVTDHRDGRIVNANLAEYLVPVNADVPALKAIYLNGRDDQADPIGVKGLGEVVLVGVAPAVANAVFHATGRRVRHLPIAPEDLL
ncbi:xanthine dehydrogenase YagR molybdenum-binding subunit [Actinoplanes lutulentus]|uniref:Xanthine dehydrogenase YagR molybdenum-binding subunit n=1 Tax=Actinoplanes lutulentus TaxID=1287878 RepID=A0A327Z540_9ACTN|nr:xanthine dehydrogenase family protein molybdopterin-binding subunit [Actinoplanes lutulentus]MBB2946314.1 xanthine dehydrogenase YagR molybdenum-binding subunit [Actinoplanes lutulentus]RAK28747.1 xanthine dehydrogenase YagR molybdenum-binding subunit [Actinoplanes lutulentus]